MKYFSCFSWIWGFELWIINAYEQMMCSPNSQEKVQGTRDTNWQPLECSHIGTEWLARNNSYANNWSHILNRSEVLWQNLPDSSEREVGITCVWFSEIDKYATQIYKSHFPNHPEYGDITRINAEELPYFDCLVGWFPCQSFSIAGKRGGFSDTRGTLFFEIARILKAKQPRLFVLENVKWLLSHDNWNTFKVIISTLTELGYDLQWQVINSKNHWVAQNRERVYIVWHSRGESRPKVFPFWYNRKETDGVSWQCGNTLTARYYWWQANWNYIIESKLDAQKDWLNIVNGYNASYDATKTNTWEILPILPKENWKTEIQQLKTDESSSLWQDEVLQSWLYEEGIYLKNDKGRSEIHSGSQKSENDICEVLSVWNLSPEKENWNTPQEWELEWQYSPKFTRGLPIMSQQNTQSEKVQNMWWEAQRTGILQQTLPPIQEIRIRRLTVVEACRLQGFPDNWCDSVSNSQAYKCLWNAVTTNVVRDIFISILWTDPAQPAEAPSSLQSENMRSATSASEFTQE